MKKMALILACIATIAISQVADATPFTSTFEDTNRNWATWTAATNDAYDPLGTPNIVSTSVTMDDVSAQLQNITFNLNTYNFNVKSGDLFIDAGADQVWDYVVRSLNTTLNGSATLNLYSINVGIHDPNAYAMSYYGANPATYRSGLPIGLAATPSADALLGSVAYLANKSKISFDFGVSSPLSFLGDDFIIGYAVTCANDVIYQQVPPVPEPGTVVLLGAGLLGLGIYGRRKAKK